MRFYDWSVAVDSACTAAIAGEDSVTFTVGTTTLIPPSFKVTGIVFIGTAGTPLSYDVALDRFATLDGYLYSGTQKTFDMRSEAGAPLAPIAANVQLSYPAVGTRQEDSVALRNIVRSITFHFNYRLPPVAAP